MLVIHDEQLARKLQQIAEREKRPVEDVLASMVAQYPAAYSAESSPKSTKADKSEGVREVRRKAYAKARKYWESVGDLEKAAMSDEELDEEFGAFDEEGIPRLKSELESDPPPGSLAYAAMIAERGRLYSGSLDLAERSEEILEEFFADDILKRKRGEDGSEQNPRR
jgi:hypothetical protein